jgi:hypothetical protein
LNCLDRSTNIISQLMSSNPLNSSKKTPTILEENEVETQSIPSPPLLPKPNICIERLSMTQVDFISSQQSSKDNSITNQK